MKTLFVLAALMLSTSAHAQEPLYRIVPLITENGRMLLVCTLPSGEKASDGSWPVHCMPVVARPRECIETAEALDCTNEREEIKQKIKSGVWKQARIET